MTTSWTTSLSTPSCRLQHPLSPKRWFCAVVPSNVTLWNTVDKLIALHQPTVVLGGGGYNPWTVARYWAGLWGRLSGQDMPHVLPEEAQTMLGRMECDLIDEEDVEQGWLTSLVDSPYNGPVREAIKSLATEIVRT